FIGMLSALLVPVLEGVSIDVTDVWNPGRVLNLMTTYGVSLGGGVPYYVTSLIDHPDCTRDHLARLKYLGMGGAPVAAPVAERLTGLGLTVYRSYGSTEHPSMTSSHWSAPQSKRLYTDG